ncbi:MAG TPA: carbohydrate ABC transporter permease [Victivallales bacterium]|nr:carbohydrate ABC transporter permease [Victivallales bacterium]
MKLKKKFTIKQISLIVVLVFLLVLLFLPVWFSLVVSFTSSIASLKGGLYFWPKVFSMEGYGILFNSINYLRPLFNSAFVTIVGTCSHVIFCSLAAYTLIQARVPGIKWITVFILITMAVPQQVLMIPTYLLYKDLGLINTYASLMIYSVVQGFSILLMHSYFKGIPKDLAESARIDGAREWQIYWKIYVPMGIPGLVTIFMLDAVSRWNNYTAALLFITKPELYTVQLTLKTLVGATEQASSNFIIAPNTQMAAVVVGLLPLVILYVFLQKFVVKGTNAGAVKE